MVKTKFSLSRKKVMTSYIFRLLLKLKSSGHVFASPNHFQREKFEKTFKQKIKLPASFRSLKPPPSPQACGAEKLHKRVAPAKVLYEGQQESDEQRQALHLRWLEILLRRCG